MDFDRCRRGKGLLRDMGQLTAVNEKALERLTVSYLGDALRPAGRPPRLRERPEALREALGFVQTNEMRFEGSANGPR
jgi:hypothetical protein